MTKASRLFDCSLKIVLALSLLFSLIPLSSTKAFADEPLQNSVWNGEKDPAWFKEQLGLTQLQGDTAEIHISEANELASFAAWANESTSNDAEKIKVVLDNDITLNDDTTSNAWDPVQQFDGVFDGCGYSIKGLLINADSRYPDTRHYGYGYDGYVGFIAMSGGTVENLSIYGYCDITSSLQGPYGPKDAHTSAAFVGRLRENGVVENCTNYVEMEMKKRITRAGVVGTSNGMVSNCSNYAELVGSGIVAIEQGGSVIACTNYADITGNDGSSSVSGVVGSADGGTVSDCINFGELIWSGYDFGIAGVVGSTAGNVTIERCANYGDVVIINWEGNYWPIASGLIGTVGGDTIVRESFNCGDIRLDYSSASYARAGSLIGELYSIASLELTNCYNTGIIDLSGSTHVSAGGLGTYLVFDSAKGNVSVMGCYNAGEVVNAPQEVPAFFDSVLLEEFTVVDSFYRSVCFEHSFVNSSDLGTALIDEQLKLSETVSALNARGEYWKADDQNMNDGYPVLRWETLDHATKQPPILEPAVNSATIYYSSEFDEDDSAFPLQVTVDWDPSLFAQPANTYNHSLAQLGSALSAMTYAEGRYVNECARGTIITGVEERKTQLTEYPSNTARANSFSFRTLRGMGFSDYDIENYYYRDEERTNDYDTVGYTLATKEITIEGESKPLVMILVRGTGANAEWLSNANVSDELMDFDDYHEGFLLAASEVETSVFDFLDAKGIGRDEALFFVTGHSRGAAVANIVSAALSNNRETRANVFGYTFAAPNCVSSDLLESNDYDNIFNIVNPEDVVPRVPLTQWGYGKYGITLYTPSSSNASGYYQKYLPDMREEFVKLTDQKRYEPYVTGTMSAKMLSALVYSLCPDVSELYKSQFSFTNEGSTRVDFSSLITLIKACLKMVFVDGESLSSSEMLSVAFGVGETIVTITSVMTLFGFVPVFEGIRMGMTIAPCVTNAHTVETYMAWMMSSDSVSIYKDRYKGLAVACPVDVYVRDSDNNLVAKIEDDIADETVMVNGLPVMVDEDGVKHIDIPDDGDYFVTIVATDNGEMDYSVGEFAGDDLAIRKLVFYDIPLVSGQSFESRIPAGVGSQSAEYSLVSDTGEQFVPDADLAGDSLKSIAISVSANGDGDVSGNALALEGELVAIDALAYNKSIFKGWYENDELVSEESHYVFRAERPRALIAKFAIPETGEGEEGSGDGDEVEGTEGEHDGQGSDKPQLTPSDTVNAKAEEKTKNDINSNSAITLVPTGDAAAPLAAVLACLAACCVAGAIAARRRMGE